MKIWILVLVEHHKGRYIIGPFSTLDSLKKYVSNHPLESKTCYYDWDEYLMDDQNAEIHY